MSLPSEPGLYLARPTAGYPWWLYIVEVSGDIPYLRIRCWDRLKDVLRVIDDPHSMKSYIFKKIEDDQF